MMNGIVILSYKIQARDRLSFVIHCPFSSLQLQIIIYTTEWSGVKSEYMTSSEHIDKGSWTCAI